ncbi:AAA family ATPase [Smaragdicoccus niigatensis]|uniref:AAA family ATPase n=1 Tax=Smaragdicoccus niigatensis TaxID=359359 RepID=UPI00035D1ED5|nr:SMC family ATPase [Smaragdicoccus niigatensis]
MRLHKLSITAFGPFAATVDVDFEQLSTDGLFLLHGATGSGKTTILDAIAFALYGRVPGVRGKENRLRCDYAEAAVVPRVELEATVGGRRLRLIRSPEYLRPKRRGAGETKVNAAVTLTWLDGKGNNLTRHTEVGDEVNRLLGMSAEQFFQVVMLPQGEFAKFLVAANDEREKLLERLFDTGRFKAAEEWLAEQRRKSADELETLSQARDRLVSEIKGATAADLPADGHVEWATDLLECARLRVEQGRAEYELRSRERTEAHKRVADEEALAARLMRREQASAAMAELQAQHDTYLTWVSELEGARRSAEVAVLDAQLVSAQVRKSGAEKQVGSCAVALESDADGADLAAILQSLEAGERVSAVDQAIGTWNAEIGLLDAIIPQVEELAATESARQRAGTELESVGVRLAALTEQRAVLPTQIAEVDGELSVDSDLAAGLDALMVSARECRNQLDAAKALVQQRRAVQSAEAAAIASRSAHVSARENLVDVRERRLNSMAVELAGALVAGEPCEVCGSVEHPAPAVPGGSGATKDDEAKARAAEQRAADLKELDQERLAEARREADRLLVVSNDEPVSTLTTRHVDLVAKLDAARAATARIEALRSTIVRLQAQQSSLDEEIREAEKRSAVLTQQIASVDEDLERRRAAIGDVCRSDISPVARRDRLSSLVTTAGRLRDALNSSATAAEAVRELEARVGRAALDAGFETAESARQAVRGDTQIKRLESGLRAVDDRRVRAEAVLEETAPDADKPVDVLAVTAVLRAATADAEATAARLSAAKDEVAKLERLVVDLWAADSKIAPKRERHNELAGIADLVAGRGQNQRKISLRSYVLAARLEEVAAEASMRLRRMSGGRYEFVHSDAAGPRGTLGGLGLDVRDLYNDQVRSVKTLSGGEKFMASLSCALGLADVVANESGGTMLDTLFIDEGFGSLDGESLESVMGVIDDLREGGRIIGVVSHVEEMRQRIPARLHVVRGHLGSRLEVQVS